MGVGLSKVSGIIISCSDSVATYGDNRGEEIRLVTPGSRLGWIGVKPEPRKLNISTYICIDCCRRIDMRKWGL